MSFTRIFGSLKAFPAYNSTVHIGTQFTSKSTQVSTFLTAHNSNELLRDLATLVSHRGVVFFTDQDLTIEEQKELATRMGELSGKPKTSTLHRHPISESTGELGGDVSVISADGGIARAGLVEETRASNGWHADITFENVPADYSILKMHTIPTVGGDTLWASGYEAYDRLSPSFRTFLAGLTATHSATFFADIARAKGIPIQDPRGSPFNTGSHLTATHPIIRTNPVTGLNAVFTNRSFTTRIPELSPDESNSVLSYLNRHISENHDLQVRYRWGVNDIAIWDNRVTLHTATNDYDGRSARAGNRVVSIGERPFLDTAGKSRREALAAM